MFSETDQFHYSLAYLAAITESTRMPMGADYNLSFEEAMEVRHTIDRAIENVGTHVTPDGPPPDPTEFGVEPDEALRLLMDLERRLAAAYKRRHSAP